MSIIFRRCVAPKTQVYWSNISVKFILHKSALMIVSKLGITYRTCVAPMTGSVAQRSGSPKDFKGKYIFSRLWMDFNIILIKHIQFRFYA